MADEADKQDDASQAPEAATEPVKRTRLVAKPKPDKEEHQGQINALQQQIDAQKARLAELQDLINNKHSERKGRSGPQQQLQNQLRELSAAFKQQLGVKTRIRQELEEATKTRDALRAQTREMKNKLEFASLQRIDEQINRLEQKLSHSSLSLQEEKKALDDIKRLKASRSSVQTYNERLEQLQSDDSLRTSILERLQATDAQLNSLKAQEEDLRGKLNTLKAAETEQTADIPSLVQERDDCREVIGELRNKIQELRTEWNERNQEWWEHTQKVREQQREERKERDVKRQAEYEVRQKERAARAAEYAGDPFDAEVTQCEQLINYLSKFKPQASAAAGADSSKAQIAPPQGMMLPKKKGNDDLEAQYSYKGKKAKGKKGSKADSEVADAKPESRRLTHSIDMLNAFHKLKLEVPLTTAQVEPLLAQIQDKKQHWLDKRQAVKDGTYNAATDPDIEKATEKAEKEDEAQANGKEDEDAASPAVIDEEFEHVDPEEVKGPEAEAAIAQISNEGPLPDDTHAEADSAEGHSSPTKLPNGIPVAKPTESTIAEHDAAFPAIGSSTSPAKKAAPATSPTKPSASVVSTAGGSTSRLEEPLPSGVSLTLSVDEDDIVSVSVEANGTADSAASKETQASPGKSMHESPSPIKSVHGSPQKPTAAASPAASLSKMSYSSVL